MELCGVKSLSFAVGLYLPLSTTLPIWIGGLIRGLADYLKNRGKTKGEHNEAEELARKINKLKITMELETGATGKAFGSITAADLADKLKAELGGKIEIDRHRIVLERPIKEAGEHEVTIKLHHDVTAKLHVIVKAIGDVAPAPAPEEEPGEKTYKAKFKAKHTK